MEKKQPKTVHMLRMCESLKAQNDALSSLFGSIRMAAEFAKDVDLGRLRKMVAEVGQKAELASMILWPEEVD